VRKIVVYELLSLDGVAEDPDSFFADWDDAMDAAATGRLLAIHRVVPYHLGNAGVPGPRVSRVPPTAVMYGDTAGYDSVVPGTLVPQVVDPESPAAANEETPASAVMARTALITEVYAGEAWFSASAQAP
jgi:hypothetical protein